MFNEPATDRDITAIAEVAEGIIFAWSHDPVALDVVTSIIRQYPHRLADAVELAREGEGA